MKIKDLIKELEWYDKELQIIVQNQPFIIVDIGSFNNNTVVHLFSMDEHALKTRIKRCIDRG
jgi:hypothetical protein